METFVGKEHREDYFHDASEHGILWSLLHEYLHIIVFNYTLHGMIKFKVKFIRKQEWVQRASVVFILHCWYLTIKFALIAAGMYSFNTELEARSISWSEYNCSLANHAEVFSRWQVVNGTSSSPRENPYSNGSQIKWLKYLADKLRVDLNLDAPALGAKYLHIYGGPYKWLGNRATLLYGFYAIALAIMLAIFPIELIYSKIDFNYIRFVLSEPSCMADLYRNRRRHLDKFTRWSRTQTDSKITLGCKVAANRRALRFVYANDCNRLPVQMVVASLEGSRGPDDDHGLQPVVHMRDTSIARRLLSIKEKRERNADIERELTADPKSFRVSFLSINHQEMPVHSKEVAWRNLQKFKPFVRSEMWFKSAMLLYPAAVFFYFTLLVGICGVITLFFGSELAQINCNVERAANETTSSTNHPLLSNWSFLDYLTYFENIYTIYVISCASSFYCSYYFGTITELHAWIKELSQQLYLCKVVHGLDELNNSIDYYNYLMKHRRGRASRGRMLNLHSIESLIAENAAHIKQRYFQHHKVSANHSRCQEYAECVNDFGGFDSLIKHLTHIALASQSNRYKAYEMAGFKMLNRRQTLLRATYLNMCLFFDELRETRYMTQKILGRTVLITFGFALMASITRSQFKSNFWQLTVLVGCSLVILNFYLAYAAIINTGINKLLVQVHSLLASSIEANSEDADLFEFWTRLIRSVGMDRDASCYRVYGCKITWATILNFNSSVCTIYCYSLRDRF